MTFAWISPSIVSVILFQPFSECLMKNTVILFCCHFWSDGLGKVFAELRKECQRHADVVVSYDASKNPNTPSGEWPVHVYNRNQTTGRAYAFPVHEQVWHHIDYPMLDYYLNHRRYDYYWRVEYDARFGGPWSDFFRHFTNNRADLLGAYVKRYDDDPYWFWWNALNFTAAREDLRGIFLPVARFSARALDALDSHYRRGHTGYCEVVVPTLLHRERMRIEDFGKRFYDLSTFNYSAFVVRKRGRLHHPVRRVGFGTRLKKTMELIRSRRRFP